MSKRSYRLALGLNLTLIFTLILPQALQSFEPEKLLAMRFFEQEEPARLLLETSGNASVQRLATENKKQVILELCGVTLQEKIEDEKNPVPVMIDPSAGQSNVELIQLYVLKPSGSEADGEKPQPFPSSAFSSSSSSSSSSSLLPSSSGCLRLAVTLKQPTDVQIIEGERSLELLIPKHAGVSVTSDEPAPAFLPSPLSSLPPSVATNPLPEQSLSSALAELVSHSSSSSNSSSGGAPGAYRERQPEGLLQAILPPRKLQEKGLPTVLGDRLEPAGLLSQLSAPKTELALQRWHAVTTKNAALAPTLLERTTVRKKGAPLKAQSRAQARLARRKQTKSLPLASSPRAAPSVTPDDGEGFGRKLAPWEKELAAQNTSTLAGNRFVEGDARPKFSSSRDVLRFLAAAPEDGAADTTTEVSSNADTDSQEANAGKRKVGSNYSNEEVLDHLKAKKGKHHYIGHPINLQVRDAEVTDVLRLIGEASGFNMVIGSDVGGKITLSLEGVPWDQALEMILVNQQLEAHRNNNVLRVVTAKNYLQEKEQELQTVVFEKLQAPRVTEVIKISYADITKLQPILARMFSSIGSSGGGGSAGGASAGGGSSAGAGGGQNSVVTVGSSTKLLDANNVAAIQVDLRTNSLVIRDLPENVSKIKALVAILDAQTPQVMIEARIVEASESFGTALGGNLGLGSGDSRMLASFNGADPLDALVGSPGVFAAGADFAKSSSSNPFYSTFGLSPNLSFIPGGMTLNAVLNWGEAQSLVKVVSSPKTVVLNKQTASIIQGTPVSVPATTTVAGVGPLVQTSSVQSANISLNVTPTVTNDFSVLMQLDISKDEPQPLPGSKDFGIGTRNMKTQVLVDSGTTLVIGGIYTMQSTHVESGIPFLRKLPVIGALFGSEQDGITRTELFIFITPKILNGKEAGITG